MKYFLIAVFSLSFYLNGFSQMGFSIAYGQANDQELESFLRGLDPQFRLDKDPILGFGPRFSIDYWHRLKNKRIEFLPEFSFSTFKNKIHTAEALYNMNVALYGFQYNVNFYFLDFNGDCDCPTFSKQGPTFKKGFYIQLAPGLTGVNKKLVSDARDFNELEMVFSLGGGLGFDIGLSDLLTITPFVKAAWYFNTDWERFSSFLFPPAGVSYSTDNQLHQIVVGIRLGFRWDQ